MFGPKSRNNKRFSSSVTQEFGPVRARMRRITRVAFACPVLFLGLSATVGEQDIFALLNARENETPRWMMALEPANFTSKITPKLELGTPAVPDHRSAPLLTLTSADKDFLSKPVPGLEDVARSVRPTDVPDTIKTNASAKGDRRSQWRRIATSSTCLPAISMPCRA